jgi:ATP-dependent helicase HrpB
MLSRAIAASTVPLPIGAVLPQLITALTGPGAGGAAVLVSPPGTGKTSLVPLALADHLAASGVTGTVIVAEPRRVAVRAAARRMAQLVTEPVGERIGYTIRGERHTGPRTRIEVVTTGVLVQRLQRDQELTRVAAIVLDECHERHLDTDLALAFAIESRAVLRPDLLLLATSATAQSQRLAAVLGSAGEPAPVIGADAPLFDVTPVWAAPQLTLDPPRGLRVDPRLLDHVALTIRRALREQPGDILVFLPGTGEISGVAARLGSLDEAAVLRLHGQLSSADQDAALRPGDRRRIVLATAVAESSLTVPGVRIVIDAGLSRVPRMDLARGLGSLATVRVSRASAVQRAGRAGREAPGVVYRCWSQADDARLPAHPEPEIAIADLTGFALALARWGTPDGAGLALLDPPPAAALTVARQTLHDLGAVDDSGQITARGTRIAQAGVHPRLARALLDGAPLIGADRAAEVVAILAADGPGDGDDLVAGWRRLRDGADRGATSRWREETRRLRADAGRTDKGRTDSGRDGAGRDGGVQASRTSPSDDLAAGMVIGLAYPERLARRRPGPPSTTSPAAAAGGRAAAGTSYLMASGTAADLAPGSALTGAPWLAIAVAQRQPGAASAIVRLAAALDEASALEIADAMLTSADEVTWDGGDVRARQVRRLGAIVLTERPLREVPPGAAQAALRTGLAEEGLSMLCWSPAALGLRARLAFCHQAEPERDWPEVSDTALLAGLSRWLGSALDRASRRADLSSIDLVTALRGLCGYRELARLDDVAPERIQVPSGSRVRIDYADPPAPVLAVKLQEVFGWTATPRIGGGRVGLVLHLLSPAGRPVAVTADLESFWRNGYQAVRSELRGRYPRHPWPDDPLTATPTRRLTPRS